MLVRITSKRQVTLPAHVLDTLGVQPGDHLQLEEGPGGFILRPRQLQPVPPRAAAGQGPGRQRRTFDRRNVPRVGSYDPSLRD